ncbi:MAG: hypothetical protein Q7S33_05600 [Nanoarchaeota archaeon]|nr:hypothetical protein [Nanoarchaeota archaeon]
MGINKNKTVLGVTLSRLISILVLLLLLGIANIININNSVYLNIIEFLNQNLGLVIIFSILFYLGELFLVFSFPLNLPAPIFNAFGGIFLVNFIFEIFYMIKITLNQEAFSAFQSLEPLVLILVFITTLIFGYVKIFSNLNQKSKKPKKQKEKSKNKQDIEWQDIGDEFKMAIYNLASSIKQSLEPKKKQKS